MEQCAAAVAMALLCAGLPASATEQDHAEDFRVKVKAVVTLGATVRAGEASPEVYGRIPSSVVAGAAPGQLMGQTGGSDLNFNKHGVVSAVVKGLVDMDLSARPFGLFLRASAWHDLALGQRSAAYGNFPNHFEGGQPLSDAGFTPDAKFSGARLRDAYVYATGSLGEGRTAQVRMGRQVLSWGTNQLLVGGVGAATNPTDIVGQLRPGALPEEGRVPVGMVSVALASPDGWALEGHVPYEFRPGNTPGCGTFFDVVSVAAPGCDMAGAVGAPIAGTPLSTLASLTERSILASGYFLHRNPDVMPGGTGQFGLAVTFKWDPIATTVRAYVARTHHSARSLFRLTVENINGGTLPAGVAGGLARLTQAQGLRYSVLFPQSTRMLGLSFDTMPSRATRVVGELAFRPNQPVGMSAVDLLSAGLLRSPASLLALQRGYLSVPAGGAFDGYDRFAVANASVGIVHVLPKMAGAERITLAAELGTSRIRGLPDPAVMRYGRGLAFGSAPYLVNGALTPCSESAPGLSGVPGRTCTTDGYVSPSAWGLRMRWAATYAGLPSGAVLTPSLLLGKDFQGYSHDGTFSKGRLTARAGLRADWDGRYFIDVGYARFGGGRYNLLADRSHVNVAAGIGI